MNLDQNLLQFSRSGQVVRQKFNSKNLAPVQERHWLFPAPLHVSHSAWQASQVFVPEFSNTLVATQAVGHAVPSRYLPFGQDEHSLFVGPVHVEHSAWQLSQVSVPVFPYLPAGHVTTQELTSKKKVASQSVQLFVVVTQVLQFVSH